MLSAKMAAILSRPKCVKRIAVCQYNGPNSAAKETDPITFA